MHWCELGLLRLLAGLGSPGRSGARIDSLAVKPAPHGVALGTCPARFCSSAFRECPALTSPVFSGSVQPFCMEAYLSFIHVSPGISEAAGLPSVCLFLLAVPTLLEWMKSVSLCSR